MTRSIYSEMPRLLLTGLAAGVLFTSVSPSAVAQTIPQPEQVRRPVIQREVEREIQRVEPRVVEQIRDVELQIRVANVENIELLQTIGRYEGALRAYRVGRTPSDLDSRMRDLAERMGGSAEMPFNTDDVARLDQTRMSMRNSEDPSAVFEYDRRTGNFLFNAGLMKMRDDSSTPDLPRQSELAELAQRHLQEFGLDVNTREMNVAHLGGLNMAIPDGNGGSTVFEKLKSVRFERVMDGLPVEGDTRLIVQLGEGGSLAGMVYQWPNFGRGQEISQRLMADPQDMQQQALETVQAMAADTERAWLTAVDLVLYDDGRGFMEPAYHVVLNRMIDLGEGEPAMIPYDFYLPVLSEPRAFFPFMEQAERAPENGEDEGALRNGEDE